MYRIFDVGTGESRKKRIQKLDDLYKSFGIEFEKVEQKDNSRIAYFVKNISSYNEYVEKDFEIVMNLIEDSLMIDILESVYPDQEQYYYKTVVEKASKKEVQYNYGTCYYLVEGRYDGLFAGEDVEVLQFLLNKGLIKCEVLEKKHGPKEHIRKIAKNDFRIGDDHGFFKRYISDEHRVVVSTTRLSAIYIIKTLLSGYSLISYSRGRSFVVKYTCEKTLCEYIEKHYKEYKEVLNGTRMNFDEAYV